MIGKLPKTTNDNQYIITLMDYFSKWPEAKVVKSKSAETVALFLYKVICWYVYVQLQLLAIISADIY